MTDSRPAHPAAPPPPPHRQTAVTGGASAWEALRSPSAIRGYHPSGVGDNRRPEKRHFVPPRPVPGRGWMVSMITSVISLRPRCWWRMAARSPGPFPSKQEGTAAGAAPVLSAAISGAAQQKRGVGTGRWERSPGAGWHPDPPAAPGRRPRPPPPAPGGPGTGHSSLPRHGGQG